MLLQPGSYGSCPWLKKYSVLLLGNVTRAYRLFIMGRQLCLWKSKIVHVFCLCLCAETRQTETALLYVFKKCCLSRILIKQKSSKWPWFSVPNICICFLRQDGQVTGSTENLISPSSRTAAYAYEARKMLRYCGQL